MKTLSLKKDYSTTSSTSPIQELKAELTGFFEDILKNGSQLRIRVTGRSMSPFLKGGEILTVRKVPYQVLHRGDIILFRNEHDHPVVHRIIRKDLSSHDHTVIFHTKGDAIGTFDEPVYEDAVLGKVCTIERNPSGSGAKQINMESPLWRIVTVSQAMLSLMKTTSYWQMLRRLKSRALKLFNI